MQGMVFFVLTKEQGVTSVIVVFTLAVRGASWFPRVVPRKVSSLWQLHKTPSRWFLITTRR